MYILLLIPSLEKKKKFIYFLPRSKLKLRPTFDFFPNPASFHLHPPSQKRTANSNRLQTTRISSNLLKPSQTSSNLLKLIHLPRIPNLFIPFPPQKRIIIDPIVSICCPPGDKVVSCRRSIPFFPPLSLS